MFYKLTITQRGAQQAFSSRMRWHALRPLLSKAMANVTVTSVEFDDRASAMRAYEKARAVLKPGEALELIAYELVATSG